MNQKELFCNSFIILFLLISLFSCKDEERESNTKKVKKNVLSNLQFDHFNIWVENPKKAKKN
ncbi:hypothetical protein THALO_350281 [Tenacibaculum halocynthiae]